MNGAGSIPASVVTTPLGRPEALFRVGAAEQDGQGVRAQMRTGPWMRGRDSGTCAGSLGVFLDDLLGNALLAGRPEDYWPVSTELSIELAAPAACRRLGAHRAGLAGQPRTGRRTQPGDRHRQFGRADRDGYDPGALPARPAGPAHRIRTGRQRRPPWMMRPGRSPPWPCWAPWPAARTAQ